AERQAHELGNQAEVAEIWHAQAALLADDDMIDAALSVYQRAHDLFVQLDNLPAAAVAALEQGRLAFERGMVDVAEAYFRTAAPALDRRPYHHWRCDYGLARCAEAHGHPAEALDRYRAASTTVGALRRQLASEETSSGLYAQAAQLHTDALRVAVRLG